MVDGGSAVLSYQRYTACGEVRDGTHTVTSIDFTGQRRDDSGLLFYNARYYDPKLARFLSADTVVPESGALTVQALDATERMHWAKDAVGTAAPPTLNRYSYVDNNPLRNTDPTGHVVVIDKIQAAYFAELFFSARQELETAIADANNQLELVSLITAVGTAAATRVLQGFSGEVADLFATFFSSFGAMAGAGYADDLLQLVEFLETGLTLFAGSDAASPTMSIWVDEVYSRTGTTQSLKYFYETPMTRMHGGGVQSRHLPPNISPYFMSLFGDEHDIVKVRDYKTRKPIPRGARPPHEER